MSISQQVLNYHFDLQVGIKKYKLPRGIDWLLPYNETETRRVMTAFYDKYYKDRQPRKLIFGINPGRFGAGLTGVPFTDPVKMQTECQIENSFDKKSELSAQFIYGMINQFGGARTFFKQFYISSLCPLGFIKNGVNYNYYDDKLLTQSVTPFIVANIEAQKSIARSDSEKAYCLGEGKNYSFFSRLNEEHQFFKQIVPLPHPRWIMQYKRKRIDHYLEYYLEKFGGEGLGQATRETI